MKYVFRNIIYYFLTKYLLPIAAAFFLFLMFSPTLIYASNESPTQETMESLFQKCKLEYTKGDYNTARLHIEQFMSLYPESSNADEILFMQTFLQPSIDASIKGYQKLIEKYPNSKFIAKAYFQLGQLYYFQNDYDKALEKFGRVIVSYSDDNVYWTTRYWRCKTLMAKGEYESAISSLNSLIESAFRELGKDTILMALGNCYTSMGDHEKARATYASIIESIPGSPWTPSAHILMAKSLQILGKAEEVKPLLQKLIEAYPDSLETQQAKDILNSLSPEKVEQVKPVEKTVEETEESKPVIITPVEPPKTETTKQMDSGHYFSIQVGAFSSKNIADDLVNNLKNKGYYVEVLKSSTKKGDIYKVRVGKFKSREEATKVERDLKTKENLPTGIVYE
jgi:TolA-binding protein